VAGRQTRQILFFLTQEDELAVAEKVVERLPAVKFIDEWHWEEVDSPPVRDSLLQCDRMVGIWPSHIVHSIHGVARQNGTIDGPDLGVIVQWRRCWQVGNDLKAGRWAIRSDPSDKAVAGFLRTLWAVMEESTGNRLIRTSGDLTTGDRVERRFRVGKEASSRASRGEITLVADRLTLAPEAD
jgi:hypothetical protein